MKLGYYGLGLALLLAAVLPLAAAQADADQPYRGYKVVRVNIESWSQGEDLLNLGAILMSCHEGIGWVDYAVPGKVLAALDLYGLTYGILSDDLQRDLDRNRAEIEARGTAGPGDADWFDNFHNFDEIYAKLQQMATDRPDLVTMVNLGNSLENRPIMGIRISGPGSNKPAVLYHGGQHAREWATQITCMFIADRLVYGYDTNPYYKSLVDRLEWFIVPVFNPDGYVYSWTPNNRLWRKNRRPGTCYGVDLNRNWGGPGFGGQGSSSNPCSDTYRGTAAFSEPETTVFRDFMIANPRLVAHMDFHTYAQLVMSAYGYKSGLPADHPTLLMLDREMSNEIRLPYGKVYDYGNIYNTIYPAGGVAVDWTYDDQQIFSFTIEMRDEGSYGFVMPPSEIIPNATENFYAILALSEWATTPVRFSFPMGLPRQLQIGQPENVQVKIIGFGSAIDQSSGKVHYRFGKQGSFAEAAMTYLGNDVYQATLPGTPCGRILQYYFSAKTLAGLSGVSPTNAPTAVYSANSGPIYLLHEATMGAHPGWTMEGLWAYGQPSGSGGQLGGPDPATGYSGNNVVGYNLSGDYENNLPVRNVTTPAIDCTGKIGVTLSFHRWLSVDKSTEDHAAVQVSRNGTDWTTVWANDLPVITDRGWVPVDYDISAVADNQPTVYIRWAMGPTSSSRQYCGWNLDDVLVWAPDRTDCPRKPGDLNCDGEINFADINAFVLALSGELEYYKQYPDCNWLNADCNNDGEVNFGDINPFVELLGG